MERYTQSTTRRVSSEYLLIKDVSDSEEDLQALLDFRDGLLSNVNLLPVHTVEGTPLQAASPATAKHWVETLTHHGVETSFRKSRGADMGQRFLYALSGESLILLRSHGDWERNLDDNSAKDLCVVFDMMANSY